MNSKDIRNNFLNFFKSKDHQVVPSAPIVVKNDPTLMFTNAGMNQFKDFFLGNSVPEKTRVADSQKCLRVSGKHNDLEEVGIDTYHHTMFEMLGNWSFGDYFKKEAIGWAWELLTEVYGLPEERLYATVFEGDDSEGLSPDNESKDLWLNFLPEDRILYCSKKDNFWEMGDTGPCGPCSEIHIDLRPDAEIAKKPGAELVNKDHPLVVEIWNLVFIQYNRLKSRALESLPEKHVDTGMGFERLAMAIQGKLSNYDTDVFTPLIHKIEELCSAKYGESEETGIAIRVIADHIRAVSFTIADGQLPSNVKAGYVIRRILRRAVRYGFTFLNKKEPFLCELIPVLSEQFKDVFPELIGQKEFVSKVIREEETSFLKTLETGLKRLSQVKSEVKGNIIPGKEAFELYDTYGFPFDLTQLIAREDGLEVDEKAFQVEMQKQKDRAKQAAQSDLGDWVIVREGDEVEFIGYDALESESQILRYREVNQKKKTFYQLVLETTPFYAESGGQIGDSGILINQKEEIPIFDTKKENNLIIHFTNKLPQNPEATFQAKVATGRRMLIENNHSATHLLHAALRQVLGDHVQQKGSLVSDQVLRFDFSHFSKMTDEEITEVEQIVNQRIRTNIALDEKRNIPIEKAKELGAMALFGEKYGDYVRVITFDPKYSVELCGGTHVQATGQLGFFKIKSESAVAAGVRRIEAVTANEAEELVREQFGLLNEIKSMLKVPDLRNAIEGLMKEKAELNKTVESFHLKALGHIKQRLLSGISDQNDTISIIDKVELPSADLLKKLAFEMRNELNSFSLVLAADIDGKPQIAVMFSDDLVSDKNMDAGKVVRELAREIKGGGGGQPFFATAGGKDITGLDNVVIKAKETLAVIN